MTREEANALFDEAIALGPEAFAEKRAGRARGDLCRAIRTAHISYVRAARALARLVPDAVRFDPRGPTPHFFYVTLSSSGVRAWSAWDVGERSFCAMNGEWMGGRESLLRDDLCDAAGRIPVTGGR